MTHELVNPTAYWSNHTVYVHDDYLSSAQTSLDYFHWRCEQYPGYLDLMPVAGLDGLDVVDFGCGPGHDLVGIATYSKPNSLQGLDVSDRALEIARHRIAMHEFEVKVSVEKLSEHGIDLPDNSIDYIHSSGVLHHVSDLRSTLLEFSRVLRPNGRARIMVYNRDSLWWHLYVPYVMQIRKKIFDLDMPLSEAFRMSTDGFNCPISVAYTPDTFAEVAETVGLSTEFLGASISVTEEDVWHRYGQKAKTDRRLAAGHRDFLLSVSEDSTGRLMHSGKVPGINLTLELKKA